MCKDAAVKVHPIASLSMGRKGKQVVDYQALKEPGIIIFLMMIRYRMNYQRSNGLLKSTGGVLMAS